MFTRPPIGRVGAAGDSSAAAAPDKLRAGHATCLSLLATAEQRDATAAVLTSVAAGKLEPERRPVPYLIHNCNEHLLSPGK